MGCKKGTVNAHWYDTFNKKISQQKTNASSSSNKPPTDTDFIQRYKKYVSHQSVTIQRVLRYLTLEPLWTCPWLSNYVTDVHPDKESEYLESQKKISPVEGLEIDNLEHYLDLVCEAHFILLPDVPIVGWDLALTEEHGPVFLEVNLSCNFFKGSFDRENYFHLLDGYFQYLEEGKVYHGDKNKGATKMMSSTTENVISGNSTDIQTNQEETKGEGLLKKKNQ